MAEQKKAGRPATKQFSTQSTGAKKEISSSNKTTSPKQKIINEIENKFLDFKVGERAMVFKLNDSRNHLMLRNRAQLSKYGGVLNLRYSKSFDTPIFEQQNPEVEAEITPVEFDDGLLLAPKGDVCLQKFLIANPKFDRVYTLEDKEREAEEELKLYEVQDEIRDFIRTKEAYEIRSVLIEFKTYNQVNDMSQTEAKVQLRKLADSIPYKVKEAIESSDRSKKYKFQTAIDAQYILVDTKENVVRWADTKDVIFSFTAGRRPVDEFIKFINSDKGYDFNLELDKRMKG